MKFCEQLYLPFSTVVWLIYISFLFEPFELVFRCSVDFCDRSCDVVFDLPSVMTWQLSRVAVSI